jgi:lipopolysaccharide export system permease protein
MKRKKRLPLLFYSYLATEMLAPFFACFIIMNGVFFLVKLIPFLNLVLEFNISLSDFIRLFSYLFPNMFLYSIPMAAMLGVTIGISRLSNDTEILAFKASGIGIYHTLPPLALIALFISIVTSYFSIMLIPAGDTAMQQMMYQLAKEKIDKGIKERVFTEALGDLVVHVNSIDKDTGEWSEVWVSDMRNRTVPAITMASSGRMDTRLEQMMVTLTLANGSLHMPEEDRFQTVTFDRYIINIPLQPPVRTPTFKSRGTMTMAELLEESKIRGLEDPAGRSYLTEFHKRLVLPVGCLILTLIGLPLGLQAGPGKKGIGIPLGLFLYIIYYILFTMGRNFATTTSANITLAMWTPNLLFLLLVLIMINRAAHEKPLFPETAYLIYDSLVKTVTQSINRLFQSVFPKKAETSLPDNKISDSESPPNTLQLHGNVNSRVFHFPQCEHYHCKNCSIEFNNVDVAIQAGFEPCRFCRNFIPESSQNDRS